MLDNLYRGRLANLALSRSSIQFVEGDIRNQQTVKEVVKGADFVYHLAAQSNVLGAARDVDYSFSTNVVGTFNVLRASSAAGVKRVIFTSSREVYGDPESVPVPETAPIAPKNAYGVSKAVGELYCRTFAQHGLDVMILRLANVYGPRDTGRVIPIFIENALHGRPLTLFGGNQILDFVWIDLVTEALVKVARVGQMQGAINIGSGRGTRLDELARRILNCVGFRSAIETRASRDDEVLQFVADTAKATLLGWRSESEPLNHLRDLVDRLRVPASGKEAPYDYGVGGGPFCHPT